MKDKNKQRFDAINTQIRSGVIFSRRDVIEGYMMGSFPFDRIASKLDLHSGYTGVKIEISVKDDMYTFARETCITYTK